MSDTKPRCKRCIKQKKGCDRERPCQRCKDNGVDLEGCISEDEGGNNKERRANVPRQSNATLLESSSPAIPLLSVSKGTPSYDSHSSHSKSANGNSSSPDGTPPSEVASHLAAQRNSQVLSFKSPVLVHSKDKRDYADNVLKDFIKHSDLKDNAKRPRLAVGYYRVRLADGSLEAVLRCTVMGCGICGRWWNEKFFKHEAAYESLSEGERGD